jgi:hypothetical protein
MIDLEVFGESSAMGTVARVLDEIEGVDRVTLVGATRWGTPWSRPQCTRERSTRCSTNYAGKAYPMRK